MAVLVERLAIAEETLRALRAGEVDAIVLDTGPGEQRIYTLETQDRPYRRLVERMSEGAALLDADGLLVYANRRLAVLLGVPLERLIGRPFCDWLDEPERPHFSRRLATATSGGHDEHTLRRLDGVSVPVLVGVNVTAEPDGLLHCLTVTDLSEQKAQQQQVQRLNTELTDRLAELHRVNNELRQAEHLLTTVNAQLQTALTSRVFLEQAKGMLAQHSGLDMDQAYKVLRKFARDHNLGLTDVAQAVASRSLPVQQLLE